VIDPTAHLLEPELRELIRERQYRDVRTVLKELAPFDVAEILAELDPADAAVAFRLMPRDAAGEAFSHMETDRQEDLVEQLGDSALRLVEAMDPDDRAALIDELPPAAAARLVEKMSPENRRITQQILGYPEESVGRLMTPDYVRVRPEWTIAHALDHIRRYGRDAETIHWIYVTDERRKLLDDLHIRQILLADPEATIESIMDRQFLALSATADREDAVHKMLDYDRTALPVLDSTGALLGIVTVDDVADVVEEEATEDIHKMAAVEALDQPYIVTGFVEMLRKRGVWLCTLLAFQALTIGVLGVFEDRLKQITALVLFIPMIIASGGNTGTQAASLVLRALALREIETRHWRRVLVKELAIGAALGAALGALGFAIALGLLSIGMGEAEGPLGVALTVGGAIQFIVVWGVLSGSMFPIILDRIGLDPATISSPLVATIMDVSGLLIYLAVATVLLGL
jgi:magnesium transporter